jgi:hypothetical protein
MDILSLVNEMRDPGSCPGRRDAIVTNAVELAASLAVLDRRTGNRTIRAEHAAIAGERLQSLAAALAVIEELAGVRRHGLDRLMAAFRAAERRFQLHRRLALTILRSGLYV